jgi:hypothetical protein
MELLKDIYASWLKLAHRRYPKTTTLYLESEVSYMRISLAFLLLSTVAWGQGVCSHSTPTSVQTRCPCTGATLSVTECQGIGGPGCQDFGSTNFCGSTCAVGVGTGCNPGGPKAKIIQLSLLKTEIETLYGNKSTMSVVTCNTDDAAFTAWLARTNPAQNARRIGN